MIVARKKSIHEKKGGKGDFVKQKKTNPGRCVSHFAVCTHLTKTKIFFF